jgi:ribosomal-protein-alanine N-acetyltransferase
MTIFETKRLIVRKLDQDDFSALTEILQDEITMKAYEHAFDDEEV